MLTASDAVGDVVAGLEAGADDYVTKPFEPAELVARLRAVLRRARPVDDAVALAVRDLELDAGGHRALQDASELRLTSIEFRLLFEMMRSAGTVMTRERLLEQVWGYDYLGDSRLVDMAVKRLRDKLGEPMEPPPYITTVRGIGYRFAVPSCL
jgi:two-component system response regulator MtrA